MSTENYPPISYGTPVVTTKENADLIREWTKECRLAKKWRMRGIVIMYHDGHGLCYEIRHEDGTVAGYDPSEFETLSYNR